LPVSQKNGRKQQKQKPCPESIVISAIIVWNLLYSSSMVDSKHHLCGTVVDGADEGVEECQRGEHSHHPQCFKSCEH